MASVIAFIFSLLSLIAAVSDAGLVNSGNRDLKSQQVPTQNLPHPQKEPICIAPTLCHRTGRDGCWAQFHFDSQHTVCLPHTVWIQWLKSASPQLICQNPAFPWKVKSPLQSEFHSELKKPTHLVQTLVKLYASPTPRYPVWMILLWQKIEVARESTSLLLSPSDTLGILRSLLVNEGSQLEPLPLLRKIGFVHLISATGIHLYAASRWCDAGVRKATFFFKVPIRLGLFLSRLLQLCLCFSIWLLNGARLGMIRPWLMMIIKQLGQFLGLSWIRGSPLFLALLFDILLTRRQPAQSVDSGRWIYALAVGGGLIGYQAFTSPGNHPRTTQEQNKRHLGLAIGSWLLIGIYECWESGTVALATPFLSLISLPILCGVVYPILLICLFFKAIGVHLFFPYLIQITAGSLHFLIRFLTQVTLYPGNLILIPRWAIITGLLGSGFALIIHQKFQLKKSFYFKNKYILFTIILILILTSRYFLFILDSSNFKSPLEAEQVVQLDVGQGDSALVFTVGGRQAGLIDTGSQKSLSDLRWLETLAQRQIQKLSWVALTHLDEDHSGGLIRLTRLIEIECIAFPSAYLATEKGKFLARSLLAMGIKISDWNSPLASPLSPLCIPFPTLPPNIHSSVKHANEVMGAIWIPLISGGFYLNGGDASSTDELRIGKWAEQLSFNRTHPRILKVSHHGSKTSTSKKLVQTLKIDQAWISVGKGNRYGHPSSITLETLKEFHVQIYRTDRDGTIRAFQLH